MRKLHPAQVDSALDVLSPKTFMSAPSSKEDGGAIAAGDIAASNGMPGADGFGNAGSGPYVNNGSLWKKIAGVVPNVVNGRDFGVKADGSTNDKNAIQAAVDYVESLGGGTVVLPCGHMRVVGTITIGAASRNVSLVGTGFPTSTEGVSYWGGSSIRSQSQSSPVIEIVNSDITLYNLGIHGTPGRRDAAYSSGEDAARGILITNGSSAKMSRVFIDHVRIANQASDGIALVGNIEKSAITNFAISFCGGDGIRIDKGTLLEIDNAGWGIAGLKIADGTIQDCSKHVIRVGDDSEVGLYNHRHVSVVNVDASRNGTGTGLEKSYQLYWRAECSEYDRSAANGEQTRGLIYIAGECNSVTGNRSFDHPDDDSVIFFGRASGNTDRSTARGTYVARNRHQQITMSDITYFVDYQNGIAVQNNVVFGLAPSDDQGHGTLVRSGMPNTLTI